MSNSEYHLGKVGFILAHSQHSHISSFNNFLIICAIKLFLQILISDIVNLLKKKSQSIKLGKYCFNVIITCECPLNVQCSVFNRVFECRSPNVPDLYPSVNMQCS